MKTESRPSRLKSYSPLRYPGGKGRLAPFLKRIILDNDLSDGVYAEPYAGGAAIACQLLLQEYVSEIHINDISRVIWAFWDAVVNRTEDLVRKVRSTRLTVRTWDMQKRILTHPDDHDDFALGFAAFYLNRTNRSGILNGGIIGGREQTGPWKIDARYNAKELAFRIESIAKRKSRIHLSRLDAVAFLQHGIKNWPEKTLVYLDPPYYVKGKRLYLNFYKPEDHKNVAELLTMTSMKQKWIVSYDNVPEIHRLYSSCNQIEYSLSYSAREARMGREVMFFCDSLQIPKF